jgi:hypothetical protein
MDRAKKSKVQIKMLVFFMFAYLLTIPCESTCFFSLLLILGGSFLFAGGYHLFLLAFPCVKMVGTGTTGEYVNFSPPFNKTCFFVF